MLLHYEEPLISQKIEVFFSKITFRKKKKLKKATFLSWLMGKRPFVLENLVLINKLIWQQSSNVTYNLS